MWWECLTLFHHIFAIQHNKPIDICRKFSLRNSDAQTGAISADYSMSVRSKKVWDFKTSINNWNEEWATVWRNVSSPKRQSLCPSAPVCLVMHLYMSLILKTGLNPINFVIHMFKYLSPKQPFPYLVKFFAITWKGIFSTEEKQSEAQSVD